MRVVPYLIAPKITGITNIFIKTKILIALSAEFHINLFMVLLFVDNKFLINTYINFSWEVSKFQNFLVALLNFGSTTIANCVNIQLLDREISLTEIFSDFVSGISSSKGYHSTTLTDSLRNSSKSGKKPFQTNILIKGKSKSQSAYLFQQVSA